MTISDIGIDFSQICTVTPTHHPIPTENIYQAVSVG